MCGRQNIVLRNSNDSATNLEKGGTVNHGNFWALLKFRIDAGDDVLAEHLSNAPRNAMYTSGDIQNQLISVLGDQIRDQILDQLRQAKWFTIIADEVTDVSNKEQLGLALRYVNPNDNLVREDLIHFME